MLTSLHRHLRREDGVAMIVSLMVAFVVLMMSTIVVAQSIHSLNSSGYDRRRLLSVNAAESGTNHWYQYLQTTPIESLDCIEKVEDIDTGPSIATFEAAATFYAADGTTVMDCATFSSTTFPSYALISSVGTVSDQTPRTIETLMRLTPNYGGFGAAILAVNATTFANNFDIYGSSGHDGDIYILNGDLTVTNTPNIRGNVYVPQGSATLSNNNTTWGNLWVRDDITINSPAIVKGSALSELGEINGSGLIEGTATALGDVDQSGGLTVNGTVSAFTEVPTTPTQDFPEIEYVAANWTGEGYTIINDAIYDDASGATTDCQEAYNWIKNTWAGSAYTNVAVRIEPAAVCTFTPSNGIQNVSVKGNLAVISNWGFNFGGQSNWNGTSGSTKLVHFISTWPGSVTSCPNKNITVGNQTNFNSQTNVFFYTPCTATLANQNAFSGQVMASNVSISNNFKMNYKPVLVPGITGITGFKQDIAYIHEA